ncbi:MAG: protein-disulfide reductase DsbD domain-containing protein [Candidatus Brocadiia bacterium]|jgi:thiol:disulfide interchange protein DsbD
MRRLLHAGLWLLIAAAGFGPAPTALAAAGDEPVQTAFFADASAVAAGQPFKVGVLFRIAPEWHIYWKYPGDAGLATEVKFELPKGFVAGELQWPLPQSFVQPGDVAGYGYTGEVLLTAQITPPKDLRVGEEFAIRAKASWLSCHDVCRPGRAELNARLAVAAQREPANGTLFGKWAARLPRTEESWTAAKHLRSVVANADTLPASAETKIAIVIVWGAKPAKVEFFPAPTEAVLTDKPSVNTAEDRTAIVMTARRSGVGAADRLDCLVVFTLADGERGGFPIQLNMPAGEAAAPSTP